MKMNSGHSPCLISNKIVSLTLNPYLLRFITFKGNLKKTRQILKDVPVLNRGHLFFY